MSQGKVGDFFANPKKESGLEIVHIKISFIYEEECFFVIGYLQKIQQFTIERYSRVLLI